MLLGRGAETMSSSGTRTARDEVVEAAARRVVALVAPQELPLFAVTAGAFRRNARRAVAGRRHTDRVLDSGLGEGIDFLTPIALSVAGIVYQQIVADLTDDALARGKRQASRLRRRLRPRPADRVPRSPDMSADVPEGGDQSEPGPEPASTATPAPAPVQAVAGSVAGSAPEGRTSPEAERLEQLKGLAAQCGVDAGLEPAVARAVAEELVAVLSAWWRDGDV
jgi:hypothetical protein